MYHLMRSMLFVSGNDKKQIKKAVESSADAIILDLEDSVPNGFKENARKTISSCLNEKILGGKTVFVRTNNMNSPGFINDINCAIHEDINGFMPPDIRSREDMVFLDKLLMQKENEYGIPKCYFELAPLIETAGSVLNLEGIIMGQDRLAAICFAGEDYLNDINGSYGNPPIAFDVPKAMIAIAARTAGIQPIDMPYWDLDDREGFIIEKRKSYELGFGGTLLINPRQIEDANKCFRPSDEEVEKLKALIKSVGDTESKGTNYGTMNGKVVGFAKKKRAQKILDTLAKSQPDIRE